MTKHTKAPWRHISQTPEIVGPQGCSIAVTVPYFKSADVDSDEQQEANGYLMAAAPELLEVVKAFLRCPSPGSSGAGYVDITVTNFNLDAARAAIEKAEGRTR